MMKRILDKAGTVFAVFLSVFCPACYPLIGAAFTAVGLGFLLSAAVMHWGMIAAIFLLLIGLALSARKHRHWGPLAIGSLGSLILYLSRFVFYNTPLLYISAAGLITASAWNFFIERRSSVLCRVSNCADSASGPSTKALLMIGFTTALFLTPTTTSAVPINSNSGFTAYKGQWIIRTQTRVHLRGNDPTAMRRDLTIIQIPTQTKRNRLQPRPPATLCPVQSDHLVTSFSDVSRFVEQVYKFLEVEVSGKKVRMQF